MNYISASEVCFRVCIAGNDEATPAVECQHTLDEMGCSFVMAQLPITNGTFESCEADAAYPPGLYPQPDGSTSTFQQYFSGVYTVGATAYSYQNAQEDQVTPSAPYSYPTPSSCSAQSTISNGVAGIDYIPAGIAASAASSAATVATATSVLPASTVAAGDASSAAASAAGTVKPAGASAGSTVLAGSAAAHSSTSSKSGADRTIIGGAIAFLAAIGAGVALL